MDHSSSNSVTFFTAIGKYAIVILELMTEFIKTMFEYSRGVLLLSEQCRVKITTAGRVKSQGGVVGIEDARQMGKKKLESVLYYNEMWH